MKRFQRRRPARRHGRRPQRVLPRPAQRHAAGRVLHRDLRVQREPARPRDRRAGDGAQADQRADPEPLLVDLGVHVELRRLGRVVRPRRAPEGRRPGLRLPRARAPAQPVRQAGRRRPHGHGLHGHAEVRGDQLGHPTAGHPGRTVRRAHVGVRLLRGPTSPALVPTTYGDPPEVANQGRTSGVIYALYGGAVGATSYIALAAFVGLRRPVYEGRHE